MLKEYFNLQWNQPKKIIKYFSIVFLFVLIFSFLPFLLTNTSFLLFDFEFQHLPFAENFIKNFKEIISGHLYSFELGMGEDILTSYTFYGLFDPFIYFCALFPLKYIEYSYMFVCLLKMVGCGITFMYFAKTIKLKPSSAIISSLLYAFCGFIVYTAPKHPFFITSPFLLPLILAGLENYLTTNKKKLLIFVIFYNSIANFYLFFPNAICLMIYYFVRHYFVSEKYFTKTLFKQLLSIAIISFCGILLASFALLPNIYAILSGARIETKGLVWYSLGHYFNLLLGLIVPIMSEHYTAYLGNLVVILLLPFIFGKKNNRHFVILCLAFFFMLLIPFFGYTFNLFSYVNNRWNYIISFFLAVNAGFILDSIDEIEVNSMKKTIRIFSIILGLLMMFALIYGIDLIINPSQNLLGLTANNLFALGFIMLVLGLLGILIIFFLHHKIVFVSQKVMPLFTQKKLSIFFVIVVVVQNIVFYSCLLHVYPTFGSYRKIQTGEVDHLFANLSDDFYRVSKRTKSFNMLDFSNDGIIYGYHSNFYYNTMVNKSIIDLIDYTNCSNDMNTVGYTGFDGRTILDTLAAVRYYALREEEVQYLPFGYKFLESHQVRKYSLDNDVNFKEKSSELDNNETTMMNIYENEYFLPLGYAYDKYILLDDVGKDSLKRERTMLQAAIIDEVVDVDVLAPISDNREIAYNSSYQLGTLFQTDEQIKLITQQEISNAEIYLDYHIKSGDLSFTTTHTLNDITKSVIQYQKGKNFYADNQNRTINLGYYDVLPAGSEIIIDLDGPQAKFNVEQLSLWINEMDEYQNAYQNLKNNSVYNLSFDGDHRIKGEINLSKSSVVTFAIPYSNGWQVKVDNELVEIFTVNSGYIGFVVSPGTHELTLTYQTPLLKEGFYLSLTVFVGLFGYFIFIKSYPVIKRKINRKSNEE